MYFILAILLTLLSLLIAGTILKQVREECGALKFMWSQGCYTACIGIVAAALLSTLGVSFTFYASTVLWKIALEGV